MVKVVVIGAAGRMGCRVVSLIRQSNSLTLVGAVEGQEHPAVGADAGITAGCGTLGVSIQSNLAEVIGRGDVLIDFSTPASSLANLKLAQQHERALVIGTTGFTDRDLHRVKTSPVSIPCVIAPNMSVGVNLTLKILADIAKALDGEFDIEVIEAHHRLKKDAPSGTALKMAQVLADATGRNLDKVGVYSRKGIIGERGSKEIGIQTIRAGDIVGDHTVLFGGIGERIEITHRAQSRDTFAAGALRAAEWVVGKQPGIYSMQDVLGIG